MRVQTIVLPVSHVFPTNFRPLVFFSSPVYGVSMGSNFPLTIWNDLNKTFRPLGIEYDDALSCKES